MWRRGETSTTAISGASREEDNGFKLVGHVIINSLTVNVYRDDSGAVFYQCPQCNVFFASKHDLLKHFTSYEALEFSKKVRL